MRFIFILIIALSASTKSAAQDVVDISQYKGKVVYLDFWASWCIPCRKSFPWMNEIRQKYSPDELAIVAVNLDKERKLAEEFLKKYPAEFEIVFDPAGSSAKKYQILGLPSSLLIDRNGKIISTQTGFFKKKISLYNSKVEAAVRQKSEE
ncbi:TlpA disulfide reductase family protein [Aliikangiella coralliicola]|nr:TlpA disulfide reductase family protein [Aliikangiella coralliicola]